ncbi:flagellar biosynthetic protein FliR [Anaeromyxobacter paludicola]|uniref:Flagellar biosynthetic protein FliR n=1 Tax=Anaeromyxobacter paludicola TaxID=2918171 RepID=A0ABM7X836_9BACT|nr:flagellar biosynthetic protein FliR [Anaeromyxobacter paludicola]BDG07996.1 flagellar biosynthetic protein FliR [Anaeromyxobacter paludicola]
MDLPLAAAYGYALVLLRTLGMFVSAPVLSARVVPMRARLGLGLLVAFAVWSGAGGPRIEPPGGIDGLAVAAAGETALGLLGGLSARWILEAARAAGQAMGLAAGIGMSQLMDPTTGDASGAVGEAVYQTAQAVAIAFGIHREAIGWLARSTAAWPPGAPRSLGDLAVRAIGSASVSAALAVRLAFPVMGAVLVGHATIGILGRSAPQLSLSSIGFSVAILAGGGALYLVAPAAAELAARAALAAFQR